MEPDVVTLSNGARVRIPNYGSLTPDQQAQRVAQVERELRVARGARNIASNRAAIREETRLTRPDTRLGRFADAVQEGMDEFGRNITMGLPDYLNAGASYISDPDDLGDLDFFERRDAFRMAQDMEAEAALPRAVDNTISAVGAIGAGLGPASAIIRGPVQAAKVGAVMGGLGGLGHGENEDLGGLAADVAIGTGVGAGSGALADLFLDRVIGGAARQTLGEAGDAGASIPSSAEAYRAQTELGIIPSVGSIGNRTARSLENALAEAPITAFASRLLPGRSAINTQADQIAALDRALPERVTGPMRQPGTPVPANDAELAAELRDVARMTDNRLTEEMRQMEGQFEGMVPPRTPVRITGTRAVPSQMRAAGESENIARGAQEEIDTILNNPRRPVDTAKDANLRQQLGNAQGQLDALRANDGSPAQIRRLERQVARLEQQIDDNMGPGFKALRQDRSFIGKQTDRGLAGRDADALYRAITRDLETAAARVGGPNARKAFRDMTQRERDIYMSQKLIEPLTTAAGASRNVPFIKRALLTGNDAEFRALVSKLTPEERSNLNASLIDSLGRNGAQDPFVPKTFADNWQRMSPAMKQEIFGGNPEALALVDAISKTAESFSARGMASNRSNSATAAGVFAMLGAAIANPAKLPTFLSVVLGLDRVVASEALAKAVAGEPTQLGQLVRRAAFALPSNPDAMEWVNSQMGMSQ